MENHWKAAAYAANVMQAMKGACRGGGDKEGAAKVRSGEAGVSCTGGSENPWNC